MTSVQEVVCSIIESLTEWGVQPNFGGKHKAFYNQIVDDTKKHFQELGKEHGNIVREDIPKEIENAIRHVLLCEIEGNDDRFNTLIEDRLSVKNKNGVELSNFAPFYPNSGRKSFVPRRRPEYVKCNAEELDPFNRFLAVKYSKAEYFFRIWFDTPGLVDGNVYEAIVSCHAMYKESCYNCKSRRTIQWIGGGSTYELWGDMICCKCNALYEIKSKKSPQKIHECFNKHNTHSGSFRRYYRNANAHRHLNLKKYLVIVSRSETYIGTGFVWPVKIAEIDTVLPCLKDSSFTTGTSIATIIKVKPRTIETWFNIPHKGLDILNFAKEAFCQCFSKVEYDALEERRASGWKINDDESGKKEENIEDSKPNVSELRRALDVLKVCDDDDWEEMYSSNTNKLMSNQES